MATNNWPSGPYVVALRDGVRLPDEVDLAGLSEDELQELFENGFLTCSVTVKGEASATMVPVSGTRLTFKPVAPGTKYLLSRFTYMRRDAESLVLESPLSHSRVLLRNGVGAALLAKCSEPMDAPGLVAGNSWIGLEEASAFMSLLLTAGMLTGVAADGEILEERRPELLQWEFHDLLFHAATRIGRHERPYGANFRFLGRVPPAPALRATIPTQTTLDLWRPDVDALKSEDVPFTRVLEDRRSVRRHGKRVLAAKQLGEFLFRSARAKGVTTKRLDCETAYEEGNRPYAAGGACYELEIYPIVHDCDGLDQGAYYYDPATHRLIFANPPTALSDEMLVLAQAATGLDQLPQVLLVVCARFQRLSWKYDSIAYATILKDVGVLFQTMYLVATAMDLAPCATGGGHADSAAQVLGLNYYEESAVGEFILGSRPEG